MSEFILPNGISHEGVLYNRVLLEELKGKQQNYLFNTAYKSQVDHIEPILMDLVVDFRSEDSKSLELNKKQVILTKLSFNDLEFILVKLREITFGEDYILDEMKCTHCGAKNKGSIKLDELEIIKEENQEKPLVTPKGQKEVEYKVLTLSDIKRYGADSKRLLNNHATETIKSTVKRLGDIENISDEMVENLSSKDIEYIVNNAPKYSHLDTNIEHTCSSCGEDFSTGLEAMSPGFFAPGKI